MPDCNFCGRQEAREVDQLQGRERSCNLDSAATKETRKTLRVQTARSTSENDNIPEGDMGGGGEAVGWTSHELQQLQEKDPDIGPIRTLMKSSMDKPSWATIAPENAVTKAYWAQWETLRLKDGVLYRLWISPTKSHTMQLVLPKCYRDQVLCQLHDNPTSGHFAANKTLGRIRQRFYWVGYTRDVKLYCSNCELCASRKGPGHRLRGPLQSYNVGAPMERIAIDVLGPLPETEHGNKYLLIAMDYFSKWPEAYPLPNQEAITVAKVLVNEFFCRFGIPLELHSDQGRNFESNVFQEVCRLLHIKKTRTTPLHPQSDGMVERLNRTIEAQLAIFARENQTDWDFHIPFLLMAYRSAVHDTTKCTQADLMFGRNLRLPIDLLYGRPEDKYIADTEYVI